MKRTISILLIVFLLMSSFGCQTVSASVPPRNFRVNSAVALKTLLNATELSDSDFAEFVAQADDQIHIPPNTQKQEIALLSQYITAVGLPLLKGGAKPDSFSFEYHPGSASIDLSCSLDGMRYRFYITPTKNIFEKIQRYRYMIRCIPVATWTLDEDTILLHWNWDWKDRSRHGVLYRNGYTVSVDLISYTDEPVWGFPFVTSAEFVWSNTLEQPFSVP